MDTIAEPDVTTTETPSGSAPTTAEPSSAVETKEARPTSMREAFERMEKKAAGTTDPATTPQTAPSKAAAVVPQGPIPFDVHQKALENARTKASTEALAKHRETFGWAEKIPQQQLQQWGTLANRITTDPIGYAADLIREIEQHPQLGPAWKARQGAQPVGRTDTTQSLDPDVEIRDDQGRVVGKTFSADRVTAIVQKAVSEAIGQEVQPLKAERDARQAEANRQQMETLKTQQTELVTKQADAILSDIEQILDGDKSLFDDVDKMMSQHPEMTPHAAALAVRKEKVVPKLKGAATQEAITEMQRKAAGGATANGSGRTAMPKKPTNAKELAAWMRAQESA